MDYHTKLIHLLIDCIKTGSRQNRFLAKQALVYVNCWARVFKANNFGGEGEVKLKI